MSLRLEQTVPFGRSLREYELMFSLSAADRRSRILDCAAGPSSFNAELTAAGGDVRSIDPLYQFGGAEIQRQFFSTLDHVIEQVRATPQNWVWSYHRDPEDLRRNRIAVMEQFVALQRGDGNRSISLRRLAEPPVRNRPVRPRTVVALSLSLLGPLRCSVSPRCHSSAAARRAGSENFPSTRAPR